MEENGTKPYPMDIAALQKGTSISTAELEEIVGYPQKQNPEKFQFAVLGLKSLIEERTTMTVRTKEVDRLPTLIILDDKTASDFNNDEVRRSIGRIFRRSQKAAEVDVEQLTSTEKTDHERRLLAQGRYVQALARTMQEIKKIPKPENGPSRIAVVAESDVEENEKPT